MKYLKPEQPMPKPSQPVCVVLSRDLLVSDMPLHRCECPALIVHTQLVSGLGEEKELCTHDHESPSSSSARHQ